MKEVWKLDATAQAQLVRDGEISARELVAAALDRIDALNPRLNCVVGGDRERALARAEAPPRGPFSGVPFLTKDLLAQPGLRCSFGARLFAGFVPSEASPYANALDAAGLITLGKTTTSEFGLLGSTETDLHGITRNPWQSELSAGGSSGGAAAAVAAGLVPFAHASDGGGSIRIPAALCGLFGFMPSRGRCLPALPPSDLPSLTIEHCVSRSVRDSAALLAATEDPEGTAHAPMGLISEPPARPLRIGVYNTTLMGHAATESGRRAVESAAALCESLGHTVADASPAPVGGEQISDAFFTVAGAGIDRIASMVRDMRGSPVSEGELEPFTWAMLQRYRGLESNALERAKADIQQAAATMRVFLERWDVTLCPTVAVESPRLGFLAPSLPVETLISRTQRLAGYTPAHNMVGAPAMSVPLGATKDGLPVGCHFAASPGADSVLLGLAYQLEDAQPWASRLPALPV